MQDRNRTRNSAHSHHADESIWDERPRAGLDATISSEAAEMAEQESLARVLGRLLDVSVARNDHRDALRVSVNNLTDALCARTRSPPARNIFESHVPCPLPPSLYLERILQYTAVSPCNLVIGLIYLQRLRDSSNQSTIRLTTFNIQRYVLTAMMIASKTYDDHHVSNKQWGLVGALTVKEINELELDMLFRLEFLLKVDRDEYDACCQTLFTLDAGITRKGDALPEQPAGEIILKVDDSQFDEVVVHDCAEKQPAGPLSRRGSLASSPGQHKHDGPLGAELAPVAIAVGVA